MCGGSPEQARHSATLQGLSPRVRGKPTTAELEFPASGSIPACAGEALNPPPKLPMGRVYPRVCGGSTMCFPMNCPTIGLSPRVRGKPGDDALR